MTAIKQPTVTVRKSSWSCSCGERRYIRRATSETHILRAVEQHCAEFHASGCTVEIGALS